MQYPHDSIIVLPMISLMPPGPSLSRDDGRLNVEIFLRQRQVSTVELQVDGVSTIIELISIYCGLYLDSIEPH